MIAQLPPRRSRRLVSCFSAWRQAAECRVISGLRVSLDHLRAIDKRRIRRLFGQVTTSELANIDQGLELFLGLGAK